MKTFIDRLYLLPEAGVLDGKRLYFFAQGSSPDEGTINTITHLARRVAELMNMELINVVLDNSSGSKILDELKIS